MTIYARKGRNDVLLSEEQRAYLHGDIKYSYQKKSDFNKDLFIRYKNLVKDLNLIGKDEKKKQLLQGWKIQHSCKFEYNFTENIFWKSFGKWTTTPEKKYPSKIHGVKKGKIRLYWIEVRRIEKISPNEAVKALNPENMFFFLKRANLNNDEKNDLIQGYNESVIPELKKDAISRKEINKLVTKKISPFSKNSHIMTTEINEDPRNKKILEVVHSKIFLKLEKLMNTLLKPYDSKIIQMQPYLHAISSKKGNEYKE